MPAVEGLAGESSIAEWDQLRELALVAEELGFHTLLVPDHLLMRGSARWGFSDQDSRGTWEAWTIATALAAVTRRIAIGPYVLANSFRQPALVAKMAATLDEVSGGRLVLGLGTGSHPAEYRAFGYPLDHLASRFDEALQIIVPLLRSGHLERFEGRFYQVHECELKPRGPRAGGPPIWIAAFGPRVMRLAARWADAYNTSWHTHPDELHEPFQRLDAACREVGRDPASIARTIGVRVWLHEHAPAPPGMLSGPSDRLAEHLSSFVGAGVQHITCMLSPPDPRALERFAPVIRQLARRPVGHGSDDGGRR